MTTYSAGANPGFFQRGGTVGGCEYESSRQTSQGQRNGQLEKMDWTLDWTLDWTGLDSGLDWEGNFFGGGCKAQKRQTWLKYKPKFYDIFLGTTCLPSQEGKRFFAFKKKMLPSTLDKKIDYKKQVTFLLIRNTHSCYFLQLSSETWRPWVKQSDQSKPPTQTKNDRHKTKTKKQQRRVKSISDTTPSPPPQMKKYSLLGKGWKRDFFYSLEKIIQPLLPPKKIPP